MKVVIIFLISLVGTFQVLSQEKLKLTAINDLDSLQKIAPKKVCVFIYTDWCRYCGQMKYKTFKNDKVIALLNQYYYFVSFDAEQKEDVKFDGNIFHYKPNGSQIGVHEFAVKMATKNKTIVYPTTVLLNEENKMLLQLDTYVNATTMLSMLQSGLRLK